MNLIGVPVTALASPVPPPVVDVDDDADPSFAGRIESREAVRAFALAGRARLTLVSAVTGARFTFRVRASRDDARLRPRCWFVSVLTGANNDGDFEFLGTVFGDGSFRHGARSRIGRDAASARAWEWAWRQVAAGAGPVPASLEVWHEGRCGKCGRALTVPESIATGLGPVCAGK